MNQSENIPNNSVLSEGNGRVYYSPRKAAEYSLSDEVGLRVDSVIGDDTSKDMRDPADEEELPEHVQVLCRVRPSQEWILQKGRMRSFSSTYARGSCVLVGENQQSLVFIDQPTGDDIRSYSRAPKSFNFDHVAGESTTQLAIFETIGKPLVRCALQGINATVFCYGQTGKKGASLSQSALRICPISA
jgi:hypothetical protein